MRQHEDKPFTRFTMENSYGVKTIVEYNNEDIDVDDCIHAFTTMMIGATFIPETVYEGMQDYANRYLDLGNKEN